MRYTLESGATNNGSTYNFRNRDKVDYKPYYGIKPKITKTKTSKISKTSSKKERFVPYITQKFNRNEWVAATKVKNYLLKDPIIDWLDVHYKKLVLGIPTNVSAPPHIKQAQLNDKNRKLGEEKNKLKLLFDMGNRFEDLIISDLQNKFGDQIRIIINDFKELSEIKFNDTIQCMKEGVPILAQAPLYNYDNNTYGIADLIVRSDYLNKIMNTEVLSSVEECVRAPYLNGAYHYRVIDIKWSTMTLCANGKNIRNSDRFPAYKGQLAIYNAALGNIQGYVSPIAYILSKRWKYDCQNIHYEGYNCYDLLGEIDYDGFDKDYVEKTDRAIEWVKNVRTNGHAWSVSYPPTVNELYPNMNNTYDTPYHNVKKKIATENKELTEIFMVSVGNRHTAHKQGIYQWSDPKCCAKTMGIRGKKIGPLVDAVININRDKTNKKINPKTIKNNDFNWQEKASTDFYVDFETINETFYNKDINLENSKTVNGVIFMIGVGYEEYGLWCYKSFYMVNYSLSEEKRIIQEFIDFVDSKTDNGHSSVYHWGNAEKSIFNASNNRHGGIWSAWRNRTNFIDFCDIFKKEPITIKGAKKFGLKEIAKTMKQYNFISSTWDASGPGDGLSALIEATEFYVFMSSYNELQESEKQVQYSKYCTQMNMFNSIISYNEIDCKTVYEIIEYLRKNHC
jgi:hypothetical protein